MSGYSSTQLAIANTAVLPECSVRPCPKSFATAAPVTDDGGFCTGASTKLLALVGDSSSIGIRPHRGRCWGPDDCRNVLLAFKNQGR